MKNKFLIFLLALIIIVVPSVSLANNKGTIDLADVGGGLDWDKKGGDFDWGGGSDWGNGGGFDWDDDGTSGHNYGSSNFGFFPFISGGGSDVFIFMILVVILLYAFRNKVNTTSYRRSSSSTYSGNGYKAKVEDLMKGDRLNLDKLSQKDPGFSEGDFIAWANNVFIQLQEAWTDKDWKRIRTFESDTLFKTHNSQLNNYIQKNQTNVVEEIAVLNTKLEEYREDNANEYLSVIIQARYRDYLVDDLSKAVIKGDKNKKYVMIYRMNFMRTLGTKTEQIKGLDAKNCPNCGAPLSINESGVCEYCGSEVSSGDYSWLLYQLEPLNQSLA